MAVTIKGELKTVHVYRNPEGASVVIFFLDKERTDELVKQGVSDKDCKMDVVEVPNRAFTISFSDER
jgi:hypothetical protein